MRLDSLSPKTWLLVALAAWALCLWVLALFGMGGRLGEYDLPTEPQRLPTTTLPAADRPGPLTQYAEIGVRPVFAENRKPQPFVIDGSGEDVQANTFDYTLTSVLITPRVQLAILRPAADGVQPVRVKVGEAVEAAPQWSLAMLKPRSATFRGPEGEKVLELRVFDGVGGAPPPPMVASMPPPLPPPPGGVINAAPRADQPGVVSAPETAPGAVVMPAPPPPDAAPSSTQAQLEAIRKRIEARRAQLRQQSGQNPPGQTP
ncbi:MAG: general secretion pathway protein GspN [Lysobacteraceae bacterium]|nr:MAG: general secretion pathway protein GspN [Xanthomonadaceae bacterium]